MSFYKILVKNRQKMKIIKKILRERENHGSRFLNFAVTLSFLELFGQALY